MPFGAIGVLILILAILLGIFGLLSLLVSLEIAMMVFFLAVGIIMVLVILVQRPKGGGLAGAFGGVGGGQQSAFGAKVGDILTWVTVGFFIAFLLLAMGLTWKIKSDQDQQTSTQISVDESAPAEPEQPGAAPDTDQPAGQPANPP